MRTLGQSLAAALVLIWFIGCTTANREAAVRLATQGGQVSQNHREFLLDSQIMLQLDAEGRLLATAAERAGATIDMPGETPSQGSPETPAADRVSHHDELIELLKKRLNLIAELGDVMSSKLEFLHQLEQTYVVFGELARYDASADFADAAQGLATTAADHARHLMSVSGVANGPLARPLADAEDALTGLAKLTGGFVGGRMQQKRIRTGSALIRAVLEHYAVIVDGEREEFRSLYFQSYAYDRTRVASGLIGLNLARPDDLLRQHTERLGLTYVPEAFKAIPDRTYLEQSIEDVLGYRYELEGRIQQAAIDELYNGLSVLIEAHRQLERGEPVSHVQLARHLIVLRKHLRTLKQLHDRYERFAPYAEHLQSAVQWRERIVMLQDLGLIPPLRNE